MYVHLRRICPDRKVTDGRARRRRSARSGRQKHITNSMRSHGNGKGGTENRQGCPLHSPAAAFPTCSSSSRLQGRQATSDEQPTSISKRSTPFLKSNITQPQEKGQSHLSVSHTNHTVVLPTRAHHKCFVLALQFDYSSFRQRNKTARLIRTDV